jgi:hypothetical protein
MRPQKVVSDCGQMRLRILSHPFAICLRLLGIQLTVDTLRHIAVRPQCAATLDVLDEVPRPPRTQATLG